MKSRGAPTRELDLTGNAMEKPIQNATQGLRAQTLAGRLVRSLLEVNEFGLLTVIVLMAVAFTIWEPAQFATFSNLQNMSRDGAVFAIVAMGQMFPLLVGGFDISVGSLMGVASVVGVLTMLQFGLVPGLLAGLGASAGLGIINGAIISYFRITAFVVTLGMMSFARGLALQLANGTSIIGVPDSFQWFGAQDYGPIPSTVAIAVGVAASVAIILWFTRAGHYFYSIGGNEEATKLAGVRVQLYKTIAYCLSGLFAGVAGLLLSSRLVSGEPTMGQGYELQSIAIAVIGGVAIGGGEGTLLGLLLGAALITMLSSGLDIAQVTPFVQQMVVGAIIVIAVVWDRFRYGDWRIRRLTRRPAATRSSTT